MKNFREIVNEAKWGDIGNYDFKKLDKIRTGISNIVTEEDAVKFIKKYKFKGDDYYKESLISSEDIISHLNFGNSGYGDFYISIQNQQAGRGIQIKLNTMGIEKK